MEEIIGINLGSGSGWQPPSGWYGIDEINGQYLDSTSILQFSDNSIKYVYASHFFEHIDDSTATNLLSESYRVLHPSGIIRIVVPDFELFIQKYLANDEHWYRNVVGFRSRPDWEVYGVTESLDNLLLNWIANYEWYGPKGFYHGPPAIAPNEVRSKAKDCSVGEFCDWAQNKVPSQDPAVKTQHINWWSFPKFQQKLSDVGFVKISRSQYMQSQSGLFNNNKFDSWKSNRKHFSLYVEAVK